MERELNSEEISIVVSKAKNFIYRLPGVLSTFSNGNPLTVLYISPKGLIFIDGNKHTGSRHIIERHSYYSDRTDWSIDSDKKSKIIEPSKFSKECLPLFDYRAIADDIFKPEHK